MNMTEEVLLALQDGQWHAFGEIMLLGNKIPAEKATQYKHVKRLKTPMALEDRVEKGRRAIVSEAVQRLLSEGRVQQEGEGFTRNLRRTPTDSLQRKMVSQLDDLDNYTKMFKDDGDKHVYVRCLEILRMLAGRIE
jgi:hypothetical protein